ncbi:hypothetical protein HYZ97_00480 [Candidatus Pacearchaeota archaeon]|nr:hypothetical protein [Candidatus Pacearchaeota archaeon]
MTKNLEQTAHSTLEQELKESIKGYPRTWIEYFKQLAPAVVVSSIGAAAGQELATRLGYDSKLATTAASYVCGYIPGYLTFFGLEYWKNRGKYSDGLFSREFAHFAGTFLAADYIADIATFTPAFIASNIWLTDNTDLSPAVRGLTAWNTSALLYISAIAGLHPLTRRITSAVNNKVKSVVKKLKRDR